VLVQAPPAVSHQEIGAAQEALRLEVQPFQRLAILAKEGINTAVVGSLEGWPLDRARAIVVLSPAPGYLGQGDLAALGGYLQQGGRLVTSSQVAAALIEGLEETSHAGATEPELLYDGLVEKRGNLYVAQKGVAVLFEDQRHDLLSGFWREVLGLASPQPGYRVITDRTAFHYHVGPDPVPVRMVLPYEAWGYRYDEQAQTADQLHGWRLAATLGRREYLLLNHVARSMPWVE
jgi:hypothetical protein